MLPTINKTKIIFVILVLVNVRQNKCESENDFDIDEVRGVEELLRGSGEERIPNVVIPNSESEEIAENSENHIENETVALKKPLSNETESTTDIGITSEINSSGISESNNFLKGVTKNFNKSLSRKEDLFEKMQEQDESTDLLIDSSTLSTVIDNNFHKTLDAAQESIFTNTINNTESKIDTTTSEDMLVPRIGDFDEEMDPPILRSPKTQVEANVRPNRTLLDSSPKAASKSSTLKSWMENNSSRPPVGLLVPLRTMALNRALALWNDLTKTGGLNPSDLVVVGFDSDGTLLRFEHNASAAGKAAHSAAVADTFAKLLRKYQDVHKDRAGDGTMMAIQKAVKLVPYDSALFLITDQAAGDVQRLPLALKALVEKRLKVYTIWTEPNFPSIESEMALKELRNVSSHTEGDFLHYSVQTPDIDEHNESAPVSHARQARLDAAPEVVKFDMLLIKRGGGEMMTLPVENGVLALRIYIEGPVEHAVLYPPNNAPQIDLYNESSIKAFSAASAVEATATSTDVSLVFPGVKPDDTLSVQPVHASSAGEPATVGVWYLSVRCVSCDYRLAVAARTHIHFDAYVNGKESLRVHVTGPVASVREAALVDEYGNELAKLAFSYQPIGGGAHEDHSPTPIVDLMTDVPLPNVNLTRRTYAKIVGINSRNKHFVRFSDPLTTPGLRRRTRSVAGAPDSANELEEVDSDTEQVVVDENDLILRQNERQVLLRNEMPTTIVQIGKGTKLFGSPGEIIRLFFEVTNNGRAGSVYYCFTARNEQRPNLLRLTPECSLIEAGTTVTVVLSVKIPNQPTLGSKDTVVFYASPQDTTLPASLLVHIFPIDKSMSTMDTEGPYLSYDVEHSCWGKTGEDCSRYWGSIAISARDSGGVLRLQSSPQGLYYKSDFVAGSTRDVHATYKASCCYPKVTVTVFDVYDNSYSKIMDLSSISYTAIAVIVLSVLLLILLIILLVALIYWCCKRRKESRDLPSFVSRSSR